MSIFGGSPTENWSGALVKRGDSTNMKIKKNKLNQPNKP